MKNENIIFLLSLCIKMFDINANGYAENCVYTIKVIKKTTNQFYG